MDILIIGLAIAGLVLALVTLFQSSGRDLHGWAIGLVAAAFLLTRIPT